MLIIGAGGHARELLDILLKDGYSENICFFDNTANAPSCFLNYKVFHNIPDVLTLENKPAFCLGIGKPKYRRELFQVFEHAGFVPASIISGNCFTGQNTDLGPGLNIMPFASVTNSASIGKGSLIHYYASIHHDVFVGDFCEISPGARLLGGCKVGEGTSIGTNAVVLPKIQIGNNCVIGAGAVVTKDVGEGMIVKGIPAK